ncbi:MAG: transporter substrate-binding domain-containing protein [Solobacterium sp.]|nr:transporter substrate-binding domain-containing protein [Solobacterium sp.]
MNTKNTGGWSLVLKMCIHVLIAVAVIVSASIMHGRYASVRTSDIDPVITATPSPTPSSEPEETEPTVPNDRLQRILDRGYINAVVCTEYPGFFMKDVTGDGRQGIDMAVFEEFAKELGVDYRIVNYYDTHQETLHALLENDDVDIAFGGLKGDPDYMDSTLQTDLGVYLADPLVLITRKDDNVSSVDEIIQGEKQILLTFPENEVDNFSTFLNRINYQDYLSNLGYSDPSTYKRDKAFTNLMFYVALQDNWHFGLVDRLSAVIDYNTEMWSWNYVDIHMTNTVYETYFYAKQDSSELIQAFNDFLSTKTNTYFDELNTRYGNNKVFFTDLWLYPTEVELLN